MNLQVKESLQILGLENSENTIDKQLYDLYSIEEESKFVDLAKKIGEDYLFYHDKKIEYTKIDTEFEACKNMLETTKQEITDILQNIESSQNDIYSTFFSFDELVSGTNNESLISNYQIIKQSKETLESNKKELEEKKLDDQLENYNKKINDKRNELNRLTVMSQEIPLYKNSGFKSLKEDLSKIAIMGRIFPVMFFIVASLVTITTISRMIEEDRQNIGTLKALGYSKRTIQKRYRIYSLSASILGTFLGMILGSTLIIQILYVSYGSLYDLPALVTHINVTCTSIAFAISLLSTVFVTSIITSKSLKENTAELMRPKSAKEGKNIFLEKIPFIWKRMDFLFKISFRNIFRYKRRLFMTLIGIAGCTALIYSGLGLQSSITDIGEKQFKDIRKLSMEVYLQNEISKDEIIDIENFIADKEHINNLTPVNQMSVTVEANDHEKDIFSIVISGDDADKYIGLKERINQESLILNDDGILITEKLAGILGVNKSDKIVVKTDTTTCSVKIIGITENYLYNYIYMTPNVYERIFGKDISYNGFFVNYDNNISEDEELELSNSIKENDKIASIVLEKNLNNEFQTSLGSLMSIVLLFVGCASLLSFVVLVNLNNINFEERKRELATIKLLGFNKRELQSYLFRENIILTIFGTVLGLALGAAILGIIIQSAEVETIFLAKEINIPNLLISSFMTICFTLITNLFMNKK
ncbi:MAG: ABC transporter permease, partial [Clostridia bacterium]|nr:ABC transporter permease [Clostridia bacterium]